MSTASARRGSSAEDPARKVALEALDRIERDGAYANLVLPSILARSGLDERDRHFVTELVYGTTRRRRALDHLVAPYLRHPPDVTTRNALRLGCYQLAELAVPTYAAVHGTVSVAPPRTRGLVNAVLRKVARGLEQGPPTWPSTAVELSYPDWIVDRLTADLGAGEARAALETMNESPSVTTRADGYVQDAASQWVAEAVGAAPGERVLDLCAGPGGKATALAGDGVHVIAADSQLGRAQLVARNVARLSLDRSVSVLVADGTAPPFPPASFDRVLVDAPCSGLGVLRRRADARWRVTPDEVVTLAALQQHLALAAAALVRPGGRLVYSVCTLTAAETVEVDEALRLALIDFDAVAPPSAPWRPRGRGALLLPQDADTDGMFLLRLDRRPDGGAT